MARMVVMKAVMKAELSEKIAVRSWRRTTMKRVIG